eukprot:jgi/Botrbrau1/22382/Bobra.0780s0001.1
MGCNGMGNKTSSEAKWLYNGSMFPIPSFECNKRFSPSAESGFVNDERTAHTAPRFERTPGSRGCRREISVLDDTTTFQTEKREDNSLRTMQWQEAEVV